MLVWTEPIVSSACGDYALLNAYIHILSTNVKTCFACWHCMFCICNAQFPIEEKITT